MKQSTKLLSLVLALVMAFSCMSVIGNAELVKSEVSWDNIDDADLTAEQVADLALDLVDNDLLAGMETIDLSIVGKLRLDSIDHILADIDDLTSGFIWTIGKGLLGDVGDLNFDAISGKQRSNGDLVVINALLQFIADNAGTLSKVAYGIGTDSGIDLGLIGSFLDLGDLGDSLSNIPLMLTEMLYDMLIYGSYGYDKNVEDIKDAGSTLTATYPAVDTLDEMVEEALYNLLTQPQEYEWVDDDNNPETDDVKKWDTNSYISAKLKNDYTEAEVKSMISPLSNSLFQIIDNIAQIAIDEFAVPALNNNLKKALMEAVEIDLNEVAEENLPAEIKTAFELDVDEYSRSYVNFMAYDCLKKANNGVWYYTTKKTEVEEDPVTGEPVLDEEGNEVTTRVRKFYKANFGSANKFAALINWDWNFVESTSSETGTKIVYSDIIGVDGSIVGGINNLLALVYETALTQSTKDAYVAMTGRNGWVRGTNAAQFQDNIVNVTKYILVNFGDMVFGKDSPYAKYTWDNVKDLTIVDLVSLIGPGFFEDAMPQILLPKNADGTYAFPGEDANGDNVNIYAFAAVVLRELITGIAPNVNYDDVIFLNGAVDNGGANGRQFATHTAEQWFNIIVNMGVDLGLTYLDQITNFRDFVTTEMYPGLDLDGYLLNVASADKIESTRWQQNLDAAILWCVQYVGPELSSSILSGIDYETVSAQDGPFEKLSFIFNTILPLGIVGGYSSESWELDVAVLVEGVKELLKTFDLNLILKLFGRNTNSAYDGSYNLLRDTNLVNAVLNLVNNILGLVIPGSGILTNVNATDAGTAQSLDTVISQAALKSTIQKLLTQLNGVKGSLLPNALPTVGKLIKGWGTEQSFKVPTVSLTRSLDANAGSLDTQTVTVRNASDGVWRNYTSPTDGKEYQDEQYKIQMTKVQAFNFDGKTASPYVTPSLVTTSTIDYGQTGTFTYTASGVPDTGAIVRFVITYKVYDEKGAQLGGKEYTLETLCYINYNPTDADTLTESSDNDARARSYSPFYTGLTDGWSTIQAYSPVEVYRKSAKTGAKQTLKISSSSGTVDGITMGSAEITFPKGGFSQRVYPFKGSYTETVNGTAESIIGTTSEVSATLTVTGGGVDQAAWEAAKKTPGSTTIINVRLQNTTKDADVTVPLEIRYYDDAYFNMLGTLVGNEITKNRTLVDYKNSGTSYAGEVLVSENEGDYYAEDNHSAGDNFVLKETNFATTGYNPEEEIPEGGKATEVTTIDNATAWNNYTAALQAAIRGAYQCWNANSVYNHRELYENLKVAINDVEYLKKTAEELLEENTGDSIDTYVDALQKDLVAVEGETTDKYDFTDYKMHRLNRLNDAREDANYYVFLKYEKSKKIDDIMKYFDYNWMDGADFEKLVAYHTYYAYENGSVVEKEVAKNANYDILKALLEDFDEEEREGKEEWLESKAVEYGTQTLLDVQMATNYLDLTSERMLKRNHSFLPTQLQDEIDSAVNEIGETNSGYTAGSWANYAEALADAKTAVAGDSQKAAFDAMYNLLVARKRLVKTDVAGDYAELDALIAQAQYALANQNLYDNIDKDFGMVLAELGMDPIVNIWGDEVQLFPGSALLVKERAYGEEDQDKIDDAATALKEALARLKFINTQVTGGAVSEETLVEADEDAGIEAITATVARIAANQTADLVKSLFTVTADNATVTPENITVSNDVHYTIDTDLEGFAGTNSTVTFYTLYNGTKIPVKTIKIVVDGDVNGDGTIDVLDSAYAALVASEKKELEGCYLLAGDITGDDRALTTADYGQIVNMAVGA